MDHLYKLINKIFKTCDINDDKLYFKIYDIILNNDLKLSDIKKQFKFVDNKKIKLLIEEIEFIYFNKNNLFNSLYLAVQHDYINLIKYCYKIYNSIDNDVLNYSLLYGRYEILLFLLECGLLINKEIAIRNAVIGKNINCLKCVHNKGGIICIESILYAIKYNIKDCFDYIFEHIELNVLIDNDIDLKEVVETIILSEYYDIYYYNKLFNYFDILEHLINQAIKHSHIEYLLYGIDLLKNKYLDTKIQINCKYMIKSIDKCVDCFNIIHAFDYKLISNYSAVTEAIIKKNDIDLTKSIIEHNYILDDNATLQASIIAQQTTDLTNLQLLLKNNCKISATSISAIINNIDNLTKNDLDLIKYVLEQNILLSDENYFLAFLYNYLEIIDLFISYDTNRYLLSDYMIGAIMSKDINCVIYCNNLLKKQYSDNLTILLETSLLSHAIKYDLVEIVNYLLTESYLITKEAIIYGLMFNSIESLRLIVDKIDNNLLTSDIIDIAIKYDNVECIKLLYNMHNIQFIEENVICCFENDSIESLKYINKITDTNLIISALNCIDHKILINDIKKYLIANNILKIFIN